MINRVFFSDKQTTWVKWSNSSPLGHSCITMNTNDSGPLYSTILTAYSLPDDFSMHLRTTLLMPLPSTSFSSKVLNFFIFQNLKNVFILLFSCQIEAPSVLNHAQHYAHSESFNVLVHKKYVILRKAIGRILLGNSSVKAFETFLSLDYFAEIKIFFRYIIKSSKRLNKINKIKNSSFKY
ncbi:hypothetical protein BpHYR1_002311 [Brachionus plicatilis]|uniref:Uncharacterized protein n=1 Tax=Brachionus plicatilis TaxID=10195 RepID=A0A3M7RUP7_BRAPC|nr:hypothetical protein BpHYR1_002311 [Brachionus plicatilis]